MVLHGEDSFSDCGAMEDGGRAAEAIPCRKYRLLTKITPKRSVLGRLPRHWWITLLAGRLDTWGGIGGNCQIRRIAIVVLVSLLKWYLHAQGCCIKSAGKLQLYPFPRSVGSMLSSRRRGDFEAVESPSESVPT